MNLDESTLPTPAVDATADPEVSIKVIGVGGAGSNAVDRLQMEQLDHLELAVINTDLRALQASVTTEKVSIGAALTHGLGVGGDPQQGLRAAEADRDRIARLVQDHDLVFLVAGMGGGTAGGATPLVAQLASEAGALVIAFVTMPFSFEGEHRVKQAEAGLRSLRQCCDAVIPLSNDLLLQAEIEGETVLDSFARTHDWISRAVRSIWSVLFRTGLINLDFATLRETFSTRGGKTLFGLGGAAGENAVPDAIKNLGMCPLLAIPEHSRKADRLLVNIMGGTDLTLTKVNEIMQAVTKSYGRQSHVIMGAVVEEDLHERVEICVIGTSDIGGPLSARHHSAPVKETNHQTKQAEFDFETDSENRGQFEETAMNLFEGEDLDIPTFLREGTKIKV